MFMSSRRNPEIPQRSQAADLANQVARVLLGHCTWRGKGMLPPVPLSDKTTLSRLLDDKISFAYTSLIASLIAVLICDGA